MYKKYKKITFICMNLSCGGTEKVVTNLAYYYSKKNIPTSIITLGEADLFNSFKFSKKTELIELKKKYSSFIFCRFLNIIYFIYKINKYMKKNNNSIYISFLTIPNILTTIASLNLKSVNFGSERINPKYAELSIFWRILRFIFYRRLKNLIVQTEEIKNNCKNFIFEKKIKIIPNSIDLSTVKRHHKVLKNKKLRVLFIGRIEYQKGIDILLDAIIEISKDTNRENYSFEIIGDGSLSYLVNESIRQNNLKGLLKYKSKSDLPLSHIRRSNIVIHPSRYEGMSNVVLEAMSYGKCVISTYQASSEIITNNKDGILMKSLSAIEIINSLEQVFMNKILLKDIGLNAMATIKNNYSEERIIKLWSKTLKINK